MHEGLFAADADEETDKDEQGAEETDERPGRDGGSDSGKKEAGVNGVANQGVRAVLNEFMVFFYGNDRSAPVFTKAYARPDGKSGAGKGDRNADEADPKRHERPDEIA